MTGLSDTLPDLASHLTRMRPSLPMEQQWFADRLAGQCLRFEGNPEGLRRPMLETIERLEGMERSRRS